MSLWTPSGEHPVGRPSDEAPPAGAAPGAREAAGQTGGTGGGASEAELDELRRRLADTPAEVVVANHCYGLFELAAVYLSQSPPRLGPAQLAIDALGAMVEALGARLGEAHRGLEEGLAQIRLAFVQLSTAEQARAAAGEGSPANGTT
jgi:hypothetical protein